MSNLLLRRLTRKSKIGFGDHKDLCVQELLNLSKYKELIKMYYMLDKIDFDDDVKEELEIRFERVISKPGKNYQMYYDNVYAIVTEIHDMKRTFHKDNPNKWNALNEQKREKKHYIIQNCVRQNKEKSKIHNRNRNQR